MSSVDYAIPTQLQNTPVNFPSPPPRNAEIVPYKPAPQITPQRQTAPPPVAPNQLVRDLPNSSPATTKTPQDYRTIDMKKDSLTGSYRAPRQDPLVNPSNGVSYGRYPNGVTEADVEGTAAIGKFVLGAIDQLRNNPVYERRERQREVFTPLENLAYDLGKNFAQGLQRGTSSATESAQNIFDDLWRNRPQFEIPQPKIDFTIPEIPQIELPKFPEFKFPEISFPKIKPPTPTPKPRPKAQRGTLTDKLRELELTDCGDVSLVLARVQKRLGIRSEGKWEDATYREFPLYVPSSIDEWISVRRKAPGLEGYTDSELIDDFDGSGFGGIRNGYSFSYRVQKRIQVSTGTWPDFVSYPWLELDVATVRVFERRSINQILADWAGWEIYSFQVATPQKNGCFIPTPSPSPPPSPDCCMCCPNQNQEKIDYARIKRIMQDTLKEQKFDIDVPICKCEFNEQKGEWEPKIQNKSLTFFASTKEQAEQQAVLHFENAKQLADMCVSRNKDDEAIASLPLSWQIRNEGKRPQLVIQCAERYKDENGKIGYRSAMYPITVPHWKGTPNDKPSLPTYKKGNWEGIYTLKDNSKVTINAANEAECTKILNAIKPWIPKELQEGAILKGGKINVEIKNTIVKPMYGRYFSQGQKKSKPDWRIDFP